MLDWLGSLPVTDIADAAWGVAASARAAAWDAARKAQAARLREVCAECEARA